MRDAMTANRGSLLTTSNLIRKTHIVKKRSVGYQMLENFRMER